MKDIFPIRLKNARKMKGLSLRGLSEAMGGLVSATALKKYETGKMLPSSQVLIKLSSVLGIKVDYLFKPFAVKIDISDVKYRKRSSLRQKDIDSINLRTAYSLEKYIEVEQMCGADKHFDLSYSNIIVSTADDAIAVASRFRKDFNLGEDPISTPIEILESAGVKIIEVNDVPDEFDGDSFTVGGIFVIVLNRSFQPERKRLSLFHELGHKVMRFSTKVGHTEEEKLCSIFANEVLLPSSVFINMMGRKRGDISLEELRDIQSLYGISVEAMMIKAYQIGIISERRYKHFCIKKNADQNFKRNVQASVFPDERSSRFNRLVFRLLANDEITESKCASLLECSIEDVKNRLMLV